MIRVTYILVFVSLVGLTFLNYEIKNNYQIKQKEIVKLKILISEKKENIKLMRAELAYLSRPERLRKIAEQELNMKEILPTDIWNINDISKLHFEGN